jgi:hypothetical protein
LRREKSFRLRYPSRSSLTDLGFAAVLIAINLTIVWRLLELQYSGYLESNEGMFIATARVMARQFGDWGWWPYWNGGMPFQNVYLPLFHMIVALWIRLSGWAPAHSMHLVSGVAFASTPTAVFAMARVMTGRSLYSFFAGLIYSLVSFSAIVFPAVALRRCTKTRIPSVASNRRPLANRPSAVKSTWKMPGRAATKE